MLMAPNKEVWIFSTYDDHVVELEDSVYLAGSDGPRRSVQMVIYGQARKAPRVVWTFQQASAAAVAASANSRRARSSERRRSCPDLTRKSSPASYLATPRAGSG